MSQYSGNTVDITNQNTTWTKLYNIVHDKSTVLDVGCSSGYFAKTLIDNKGCTVDGIELNSDDAKKAAQICRNVIVGNIETESILESVKTKYDYIVFADVLEHLIDPVGIIDKASKLLNKDGKLLFSVPNMAHISTIIELLNGTLQYEETGLLDRTHLHFYTRDTVIETISASKMHLEKLDYTSYDIPKDIIEKGLKQAGLVPNSSFYKNTGENDYLVFQFIAVLVKEKKQSKASNLLTPFKPIRENDLDRKKMMDHIQELEKVNLAISKELEKKESETKLLNSKLGKIMKKLYRSK